MRRIVRCLAVPALAVLAFAAPAGRGPAATWPAAEGGNVSGKATFSAPRPKQPIIVWLEREGGEVAAKPPAPLTIGQKGAQFSPAFAVVVVGQEVVFANDEDKEIDHNVYTLGAEQKNFDIFPKGTNRRYAFTKTGEISLYCSVHKLMDGKLFVAPSPAWAKVADDGSFSIPNVPAGTYTLRTYQKAKRFRDAEQKVVVRAGEVASVAVELKR